MWFTPVILGWILLISATSLKSKNTTLIQTFWDLLFRIWKLIISVIWGIGLASFFLIPAILEKNLINTQGLTEDYFDFHAHFATWRQLFFDRSWDFGASVMGPADTISFQVGWPHWWVGAGVVLLTFLVILKLIPQFVARQSPLNPPLLRGGMIVLFFTLLFLLSIFMTHGKSVLVWEQFPFLAWTQFPWRVLGLTIFANAVLGGLLTAMLIPSLIPKWSLPVGLASLALIIGLNYAYFEPIGYDASLTDSAKLTGPAWDKQRIGAIRDYLPATVKVNEVFFPEQPVQLFPHSPRGRASAHNFKVRSDYFSLDIDNQTSQPVDVQLAIFDFPEWEVVVSDIPVPTRHDNDLGELTFTVPPGKHIVTGWFRNTPIRLVGNTLTTLSLALLVIWNFKSKKQKTT
jgi:hypothetical protein